MPLREIQVGLSYCCYLYQMVTYEDIKGFEGLYKIGSDGTVISLPKQHCSGRNGSGISHRAQRILHGSRDKDGYRVIGLSKDGRVYAKKIHRLVAEAFLDNPENKKEVNHKDLDKANNTADNLEWVSHSENQKHAYANGRLNHIAIGRTIHAYNARTGEFLWTCESIKLACRTYGLDERTISRILSGSPRHKTHKGMYFRAN